MQKKHISPAWLPLVVAIVSVTATLVVWRALRKQEHVQVERVVKLATYSIEADMVADMDIRIRDLADLARLWQIRDQPSKQEFETRATLYISHVPGCVAIGWISPENALKWVVPVDGDIYLRQLLAISSESVRNKLQSTLQTRSPLVTPTIVLLQDERVVPVWVPVFAGDQFEGFIVGVFRVHPLLDDITSDHSDLGYEVVVTEARRPIYILSNAIPENEWAQEAKIELPGTEWRLRIWPGAKVFPDTLPLSRVVLLGGLIMSLQLSLTAFLGLRERNTAKRIDAVNRELTAENAERRRAEESLHRLSGRLLSLQDEERRRIARELHDSTAQLLYGLTIKLKLLSESLVSSPSQETQALSESMQMADQCVRDIRTISYLLHPPSLDELGLAPALRSLAKGFTERSGIKVDLSLPEDLGRLPRDVETALFRIVQEGLSNVHRHSGSKTARIKVFNAGGEIVLVISDDGKGFPPEILVTSAGLGVGIAGMRERARQLGGRLEIHSSSVGTEVMAILPSQYEKTIRMPVLQM